jgi:opacity protein-like surface antigen
MRRIGRIAITTALLVPLVAGPVDAQNYRWDLGVNGGFSWYSKMLDGEDFTTSGFEKARFEAGPLLGAQLGVWFTPRIGLRANFAYADRPVEVTFEDELDLDEADAIEHVNLWSGSGDLLFRFAEPNMDWAGTEFLPYVALGLGGKWINPAGDGVLCADEDDTDPDPTCQPFTAGTTTFQLDKSTSMMGLLGLGADIRVSPNFAVRLELNDRIYKPDVRLVSGIPTDDDDEFEGKTVHEIGAQLGLHLLMGLARPEVVSVVPQPLPEPEPPPVYTPPAPREEAITVCVVDPTSSTGIRTQNAVFLPERGDTMVIVNGERTLLRNSIGHVMVARDADWYIRGQPLVMNVGNNRVEYLTYQGARHIEADRLSYLGTINGYPVYADRDEVADIIVPIQTLRAERPGTDLGTLLVNRRDLRDRVEDVRFLYVPLEPTGCVFQTVQVMEQVRKGRQ